MKQMNRNITIGILSMFLVAIFAIGISGEIVNAKELQKKPRMILPFNASAKISVNGTPQYIIGLDTSKTIATIPYSSIFGYNDNNIHYLSGDWDKVANYTFYLPTSSYVNIDATGQIHNFNNWAGVILSPTGGNLDADPNTYRFYGNNMELGNEVFANMDTGFDTSKVYYFGKGYHTVSLFASAGINWVEGVSQTSINYPTINVIVNQKGRIDSLIDTTS